jgi:alanine racemase
MKIFDILRKIRKDFSPYENSIEVLIFKDNLLHNLNEYKNKFPDFPFAPVLKSNAYGHGLLEVAKILDKEKVPFFVVDSLYEARLLKAKNIKKYFLIIFLILED